MAGVDTHDQQIHPVGMNAFGVLGADHRHKDHDPEYAEENRRRKIVHFTGNPSQCHDCPQRIFHEVESRTAENLRADKQALRRDRSASTAVSVFAGEDRPQPVLTRGPLALIEHRRESSRWNRLVEDHPRLAAGMLGRRGDRQHRMAEPDSSAQDPEPRFTIMEPLEDRFTSQAVEFFESRQGLLTFDAADLVNANQAANRYRSDSFRDARVSRSRLCRDSAHSLLGLMHPGRIEPEFGVFGDKTPGPALSLIPPLRTMTDWRPSIRASQTPAHSLKATRTGFGSRDLPFPLSLGNPNHQVGHGGPWRLSLEQDLIQLDSDRHLDATLPCQVWTLRVVGTPSATLTISAEHVLERFPSADPFADRAVAAIRTVAGRDDVAHAGQAVKRVEPCPEVDPEPGDLDQSAREQSGLGVIAETQSVANPGGDPQDVFQCPGELDPQRLGTGVDPERLLVRDVADLGGERFVRRRRRPPRRAARAPTPRRGWVRSGPRPGAVRACQG